MWSLFPLSFGFNFFGEGLTVGVIATIDSLSKKYLQLELRVCSVLESKDGQVFEHIKPVYWLCISLVESADLSDRSWFSEVLFPTYFWHLCSVENIILGIVFLNNFNVLYWDTFMIVKDYFMYFYEILEKDIV